jgi:hypothetical protein
MNLRCIYCQTPFTLPRAEMLSAIITMNEKQQSHYDSHCPRCRRANSISRQRMELFFPNWQDAAKELAVAAKKEEQAAAALLKSETAKKVVKKSVVKKTVEKTEPAAKKPAAEPKARKK